MDALFSAQWVPNSPAAYFGTWMFIFILAIISRGLMAWKAILEGYWFRKHASTAVVVSSDDDGKVKVVSGGKNVLVWRTSVDIPRSLLQMVNSGVNYLLYDLYSSGGLTFRMITVMTMNVGFFFAVLGGIFFGELVFGRLSASGHVHSANGSNVESTTGQ
jgi:solute carrier family 31 (copper transporter), member 1